MCQYHQRSIEGVKTRNPNRPTISLISLEARQSVDRATIRGLCYEKFTADIIVECDQMPDTDHAFNQETWCLKFFPNGKGAGLNASLLERELPCPLIEGVRYARWIKTGEICLWDIHSHG